MLSTHHLPNMPAGEKIIMIIRKDLFILFKKILFLILLFTTPFLFFYFLIRWQPSLLVNIPALAVIILGASAYYLFAWLFFFFSFIDYYLDVWIITNKRIIDIDQRGFFSRIISEQKLSRVQDATSEIHGVIPTILRYGDVHIQTAGTVERFHFREVPNPDKIRNIIIKLAEENKRVNHEL